MKILLIENNATDFFNSRLSFALFLKEKNNDVFILIPNYDINTIPFNGLTFISYNYDRKNKSFINFITQVIDFRKIFKLNKFDIIHSYRFQPNLVTTFANIFYKSKIILHITGLGYVYSSFNLKNIILRVLSNLIYFWKSIISDRIIIQNPDDFKTLFFLKLYSKKVQIILGSGVDTKFFNKKNTIRHELRSSFGIHPYNLLFTCTTRILKEKGVIELIEAFNELFHFNNHLVLFLIGNPDESNPSHIPLIFLKNLIQNPNIRILGHRDDIFEILNSTDVFIYPSYYREGIPRSLLEALSMSLPIITTDTPGCNLTVCENLNGYLIKKVNKNEIIIAVKKILNDKNKLHLFGDHSRNIAIEQFGTNIIYSKILEVYTSLY